MNAHEQALLGALSQRAVIVSGKGGVGKTTVTGYLSRVLERSGSRVLAVEVDPRESLHRLLGVSPSAGEVVTVSGGLRLLHLRFEQALEAVVRSKIANEWLQRRILRSSAWQHVAAGAPGFKELAVLWWIFQELDGDSEQWKPDVVVLDAPAGGHAAAWLQAPALVGEAVNSGPVAEEANRLAGRLRDPEETGIVLVTTAEEMPVTESLELQQTLQSQVRSLGATLCVANGVRPEPDAVDREAAGDDQVVDIWVRSFDSQARELARLRSGIECEVIELPMLACSGGPELLEMLGLVPRERAGGRVDAG